MNTNEKNTKEKKKQKRYKCEPLRWNTPEDLPDWMKKLWIKWSDDLPAKIWELRRAGHSHCSIANILGIGKAQWNYWRNIYPPFKHALDDSEEMYRGHWEFIGQNNLFTKGFLVPLWICQMKNRFKGIWNDEQFANRVLENYGENSVDQKKAVNKLLKEGVISPAEHKLRMEAIGKAAELEEIGKIQDRIKALEEKK
jgi:hypothetical protein